MQNKKLQSMKRVIYERLLILLPQRMKAAVSFQLANCKGSPPWIPILAKVYAAEFKIFSSSTPKRSSENTKEKGKDRASGSSQGLPYKTRRSLRKGAKAAARLS